MKRLVRRIGLTAAAAAIAIATTTAVAAPAHATGHGQGWYGVWAYDVNIRQNADVWCSVYPGPSRCPVVLTTVSAPQQVYVYCQTGGEMVGINDFWVWVYGNGHYGWMASYFTDNETNVIDYVPMC